MRTSHTLLVVAAGIAVAIVPACTKSAAAANMLEAPLGLKGVVELTPAADNPLTLQKAMLGKVLFFDPRLSGTGKMSCSTCHQHDKGWTDGKDLSPKDDGSMNTRNTPSMYNVGYQTAWYWDGRAETLEKNVRLAWEKQMFGKPDEVAKTLAGIAGYKDMFQAAFSGEPTPDRISQALASFLRTLQSGDSVYDRRAAGVDRSVTPNDVIEGEQLFTGKAGCKNCHTPPLFTDKIFHNAGIGMDAPKPDLGRGGASKDEKDNGKFKTPSLRGVAKTAPYFHNASRKTLKEAVQFMAGGATPNYAAKDPLYIDQKLTDHEIDCLVAFLQSLDSTEPFTAPEVPK